MDGSLLTTDNLFPILSIDQVGSISTRTWIPPATAVNPNLDSHTWRISPLDKLCSSISWMLNVRDYDDYHGYHYRAAQAWQILITAAKMHQTMTYDDLSTVMNWSSAHFVTMSSTLYCLPVRGMACLG
jgi:hypothetical protein